MAFQRCVQYAQACTTLAITVALLTAGAVLFFALPERAHAAVSMVKPNGGECLTVGQSYTIEITFTADHVGLYYKTDGTQPAAAQGGGQIDPSYIRHPWSQTTFDWTPNSSHISETGKIWVEGHLVNHNSNNEWDVSDAVFAVRTSCIAPSSGGGSGGKIFTAFPPIPLPPVAFSPTSIRWYFMAPEYNVGEVRLYAREDFFAFRELTRETVSVKANTAGFITESELLPNTRYENRYLRVAEEGTLANASNMSNAHYPRFTLIEASRELEAAFLFSTSITVSVKNSLSYLERGESGVWFENITLNQASGWQQASRWTVTGLKADTVYQFRAKARNGEGVETSFSEVLSVITPLSGTPPAPDQPPAPTATPAVATPSPTPSAPPPSALAARLVRAKDDARVYAVVGGLKRHIPTPEIFTRYNFSWAAVDVVSHAELDSIADALLLRESGRPEVWRIERNMRRHIPNPEVFGAYGFSWEAVRDVAAFELAWYRPTRLLRQAGDVRVWLIEQGVLRWILTEEVFAQKGFSWDDVVEVLPLELAAYPEAQPLE